jgi:hypothetical protein
VTRMTVRPRLSVGRGAWRRGRGPPGARPLCRYRFAVIALPLSLCHHRFVITALQLCSVASPLCHHRFATLLGRITALRDRAPDFHRISEHIRCLCFFVLPPIHPVPDPRTSSAPLFLRRRCGRTLDAIVDQVTSLLVHGLLIGATDCSLLVHWRH